MARLKNRIALVFGAGSSPQGLSNGKAACLAYAREGARVVAVDVNPRAAAQTAKEVAQQGGECVVCEGDVRSEARIAEIVTETMDRFGAIDILHNNVGILKLGGPDTLTIADWDTTMEVNVRSVFLTCKHSLPIMVGQRRGAIVNISSVAGSRWCGRAMVGYSASKAAIEQLTRSIAVEYAPHGIRCNAIIPGLINTPMVLEPYEAIYGGVEKMISERNAICPMGRMGSAWDVANAAVFLASDDASYISGALLPVDGALSCKAF